MGPGSFFLLIHLNPDLADILGDMDFDFENLHFLDYLDTTFPYFQISRNLAWAGLGPGLGQPEPGLGRAGPGLGLGPDGPPAGIRCALDFLNLPKNIIEKIQNVCPSSAKSICYVSVCH